jgi:hypothetical protein
MLESTVIHLIHHIQFGAVCGLRAGPVKGMRSANAIFTLRAVASGPNTPDASQSVYP